jgi:AmmeMemoRadiSam system protein B
MYSGPIACHSFYAISSEIPELFIIVGPNHWGIGSSVATMKDCKWNTPLGDVEVDSEAVEEILHLSEIIEIDSLAHTREHSLEVQIPILQEVYSDFKILPISLINQNKDTSEEIGQAMAKIAEKKNVMIIGSSDFTHYEQNEFAHEQDMALIEPILRLNVENFYRVLEDRNVSACGYGAIASTMIACKKLGATKGELLKYATSGDITGDKNSVVGYGSIVFT